MDKKKKEQILLVVLIPVFLLCLLYMRSQQGDKKEQPKEKVEDIKPDEALNQIQKPLKHATTEYKSGPRDPLKDLLMVYLYKDPVKKPEKKLPLPSISISGLIWNSDMPQAILNGQVKKIGDTIEGVKIIDITKTGIIVEYMGEKIIISSSARKGKL